MSEDINKIVDELLDSSSEQHEETNEEIVSKETVSTEIEDDDVATAEEMAAEARRSAEKRAHKKEQTVEKEDAMFVNPNDQIDPYLEPDPEIPWVRYSEPEFLSRGCNHCPESYVAVKNSELCSCSKVTSCDWMRGIHTPGECLFDFVEVRFKNNRKDFYKLPDGLSVTEGDVVAVEGMPGHDIGIVSLTGEACRIQMRKKGVDVDSESIKKLFRRAKVVDIERWTESIKDEAATLRRTRQIAEELGLVMKVNDVEYQGDHSKAIFYYTADERVDFRNLIKVLAEEFKVRVEMKQIGVRQEAGKVGGIGTCGRELCCSTWLTNFKSVTTGAAKVQQILPNPQKLAGQCGKLKCCLNFEYDVYVDALKQFPPANVAIRFQKGLALYKKTDVFRGIMWYAYEGENDLYALPAAKVKEIIEMNQRQEYPEKMEDFQVELMSTSALQQETSTSEFEQELRRMADSDQGEKSTRNDRGDRGDRHERENRGNRSDRDGNRGPRHNRDHGERPERRENDERREGGARRDNGDRRNNDHRRPRPRKPMSNEENGQ
ncbi:MAG: hypothetical protein KBT45_05185 [Bacteroidales bacterium]|nr:hypothetical protein [Candidatus Colimorpha pelethequi]